MRLSWQMSTQLHWPSTASELIIRRMRRSNQAICKRSFCTRLWLHGSEGGRLAWLGRRKNLLPDFAASPSTSTHTTRLNGCAGSFQNVCRNWLTTKVTESISEAPALMYRYCRGSARSLRKRCVQTFRQAQKAACLVNRVCACVRVCARVRVCVCVCVCVCGICV